MLPRRRSGWTRIDHGPGLSRSQDRPGRKRAQLARFLHPEGSCRYLHQPSRAHTPGPMALSRRIQLSGPCKVLVFRSGNQDSRLGSCPSTMMTACVVPTSLASRELHPSLARDTHYPSRSCRNTLARRNAKPRGRTESQCNRFDGFRGGGTSANGAGSARHRAAGWAGKTGTLSWPWRAAYPKTEGSWPCWVDDWLPRREIAGPLIASSSVLIAL